MSILQPPKLQTLIEKSCLGGVWLGDDKCNARFDLSTSQKKTAAILSSSIKQLADKYNIENIGLLTLTFSEHITDAKEAQRRLNSLLTNIIKKKYIEYVGVFERQKNMRIHYHLIVVTAYDIKGYLDFSALKNRDYKTANANLRTEWAFWRKTAKLYGFGRTELLPIKSTADAVAYYVGKYITKNIQARAISKVDKKLSYDVDKGVRLVRYSNGARAGTTRFMFVSEGSKKWRQKVKVFSQIVSNYTGKNVKSMDDLSTLCGKKWAYKNKDFILSLPDDF